MAEIPARTMAAPYMKAQKSIDISPDQIQENV